MNLHKVISNILHIPRDFRGLNDVSVYNLLKESGYVGVDFLVSVEVIREALVSEPKCVEEWLVYSEDKRCKSGWYFIRTGKNRYEVGYYPPGDELCVTYEDPLDACAAFIKREIEDIKRCA